MWGTDWLGICFVRPPHAPVRAFSRRTQQVEEASISLPPSPRILLLLPSSLPVFPTSLQPGSVSDGAFVLMPVKRKCKCKCLPFYAMLFA